MRAGLERLARVRFLTVPASRQDSRSRMAGGDERLGMDSIYMAIGGKSMDVKHLTQYYMGTI